MPTSPAAKGFLALLRQQWFHLVPGEKPSSLSFASNQEMCLYRWMSRAQGAPQTYQGVWYHFLCVSGVPSAADLGADVMRRGERWRSCLCPSLCYCSHCLETTCILAFLQLWRSKDRSRNVFCHL